MSHLEDYWNAQPLVSGVKRNSSVNSRKPATVKRNHDYLYLAPDNDVHFPRHRRRPGKQSNLIRPRVTAKALSDCLCTRADGTQYILTATRNVKPKDTTLDDVDRANRMERHHTVTAGDMAPIGNVE